MALTNNKDEKKTVIKETGNSTDNQTPGETSSVADFDRSGATKRPVRKNKPLGASHEPGVMPGTEI
ncbi:hypothetical protein [Pedobacter psychroterrae]|uniref:Uncharacterized protein n=1 Tax=Pedobacter psychroterrae TaxID=2530453 RepID=A0A4R0NM25_9SPHI|nr:hypothetical protein [Pedobacter psychroterrae]TCD00364.1 hypothetical protein EZ437_14155 [Pedobacter psychroterrae]